jgi:outer membrane receptor protein involved in Fe transport
MKQRTSFLVFGLALLLAVAPAVYGQGVQSGTINGTVTSEDGQGLPGVTVTAKSPALIGERTAETGVNGDFIIRNVPPGNYSITFTMEGMKTVERTASVTLGSQSRTDATLTPAVAAETITVTGEAPSALETTTLGANLEKEVVDQLPISRTPGLVADLSPGLTNNGPLAGQVTINGAMAYDNAVMVNGVNTQDPIFGRSDGLFIEEAIEETQVLTSGISAEYGGFTGGVINTITKSGGNTFQGTFRVDMDKPEWRDETPFEKTSGIKREGDRNEQYSATLGGPIVKDRLWFFAADREAKTDINRTLFQSGIPFVTQDDAPRYEIKLTGNITDQHTLQVSYLNNDRAQVNNVQLRPIELAAVIPNGEFPNDGWVASYTGVFTNNLFGELRYSEKAFQFKGLGGTGSDFRNDSPYYAYGYITGVSGLFGAPYFDATDPEDRDNKEIYASLSYFLTTQSTGSHDLKAGYDDFTLTRTGGNSQSPTNYVFNLVDPLVDANGDLVFGPDGRLIPVFEPGISQLLLYLPTRGATLDITTQSLFVNDRWQLNNHWSFSMGARYEKVDSEATGNVTTLDTDTLVPRLGLSWDPKGDGRWKVDATYAQYAGRYNPAIFGGNTPVGNPLGVYYYYNGPAGVGRGFDPAYDLSNYVPFGAADPSSNVFYEDNISSAKVTEYTLGFGFQLPKGGYGKVAYVNRSSGDFVDNFTTLDLGCSEVVVEGVDAGCFDNIVYRNTSVPFRDYEGLQLEGQYRLTDNWTLAGNLTYQIKNEGTYEGEQGQSLPTSPYGNRPEVYPTNRTMPVGKFDDYQKYKVRMWTNYNLDMGRAGNLGIGAIFNYDSALTFSYTTNLSPTPEMRALNPGYKQLPQFTTFFGERGAGEYDDFYTFDLALNYQIPIWRTFAPFVKLTATNVLNYDSPITWNTTVTANRNGPKDSFGIPTTFIKGSRFGQATGNANYVVPREYFVSVGFRF